MYNMFWITYSNGFVGKVEFPADWTAAEVLAAERGVEIDGPFPVGV